MLSSDQLRILEAVLDAIIPPCAERGMPGAGEAGVADHLLGLLERSPDLEPAVAGGLEALGDGFLELEAGERARALNDVGLSQPGFLPLLLFNTYQGYYESPKVLAALGLPPRPPHPEGYDMEPSDLTLLEPVRARQKLYREV